MDGAQKEQTTPAAEAAARSSKARKRESDIAVPPDREASFEPQRIQKHQTRLEGTEREDPDPVCARHDAPVICKRKCRISMEWGSHRPSSPTSPKLSWMRCE